MIQCPNYSCQAMNAEAHQFCHQCQAPMPRRFLWAVGHQADHVQPGAMVADRYLCKAPQIFLDMKPGMPPGTLSEIPFSVLPYLHLVSYRLYLPQVYGWADGMLSSGEMTRLMFLENSAIHFSVSDEKVEAQVFPSLQDIWASGSAFQQLHWLWQMAQLWQPLATEHIASTLLVPEWIRVESSLIRLRQLHIPQTHQINDSETTPPQLTHLGQFWERLLSEAKPDIQPFLQQLCQKMREGYFPDGSTLVTALDLGLQAIGRSHTLKLGVSTQTDKGPSRANNQDACFPTSGSSIHTSVPLNTSTTSHTSLVVVCDGIGGHQGGEIASATAIEEITHTLQILDLPTEEEGFTPWIVEDHLTVAIAQANDAINQRNDEEKRRERARMGTTVVMGLVHDHECYIAHVGDSRVYWITRSGCHQITLDDDVASRESRLGYGTYRSVLYHPNAGALVQALGMAPSKSLSPSGQRIILGDEGLLLFCSDGLSDQDLIETCWDSILLPLFTASEPQDSSLILSQVTQDLIDLANTRNGHDNVTVGLVQWRSCQTEPIQIPDLDVLIAAYNDHVQSDDKAVSEPQTKRSNTAKQSSLVTDQTNSIAVAEGQEQQRTAFPNDVLSILSDSPSLEASESANGDTEKNPSLSPEPGQEDATSSSEDITWISPSSESQKSRRSPILVAITTVLGMFALLIVGAGAVYWGIPDVRNRIDAALGIQSQSDTSTVSSPSQRPQPNQSNPVPVPNSPSPISVGVRDMGEPLAVGHILNLRRSAPISRSIASPNGENEERTDSGESVLLLFAQPPKTEAIPSDNQDNVALRNGEIVSSKDIAVLGVVPWGSILQVKKTLPSPLQPTNTTQQGHLSAPPQQDTDNSTKETIFNAIELSDDAAPSAPKDESVNESWVQVQLCFSPPNTTGAREELSVNIETTTILPEGSIGWVSEHHLKKLSYLDKDQTSFVNDPCLSVP